MKTQIENNKLKFDKYSLVELNKKNLNDVNGGSTPFCVAFTAGLAAGFTAGVIVSVATGRN